MSNSEQADVDQAMLDQMFRDAGQHLLIKELVLQTLVSQLKTVGVDIDPTPGKMRMVNVRAEQAERELAEIKQKLEAGAVFPVVDQAQQNNTIVTVANPNRSVKIQQPLTHENNGDWINGDHNAFVESFKVQDHESVAAVKDFDFTSPEAAHLSQEQEDGRITSKKRKPATQAFPIQPIEAAPIRYNDDEEYDD